MTFPAHPDHNLELHPDLILHTAGLLYTLEEKWIVVMEMLEEFSEPKKDRIKIDSAVVMSDLSHKLLMIMIKVFVLIKLYSLWSK